MPSAEASAAQTRLARLVSGGQTGVDRAALDAALAHGLAYGGWCPAGGWAEDFTTPPGLLARYPLLREADSPDPDVRTRLNVRDSHATLVVRPRSVVSPGTELTVHAAVQMRRPHLITTGTVEEVVEWLATLGTGLTLNVAGPRESEAPGGYALTRSLLDDVLATP